MVKMDNVVRCYRGIDPVDDIPSKIMIKNGDTVATFNIPKLFDDVKNNLSKFEDYLSSPDVINASRLAALDQFELLWEKQE